MTDAEAAPALAKPLFVYALIHWALNILALLAADWIFDGFSIERWGPVLLAGAVLGLRTCS